MRSMTVLGMSLSLLTTLGCSDPPRTIETARPLNSGGNSVPTELPEVEKPSVSDPAALAVVTQALEAHTTQSPERLKKLKAISLVREGPAITFTQVPTPQRWQVWLAWPGRMRYRVEIPALPVVTLGNNHKEAWKHLGNVLPAVRDPMSPTDAEDFRIDATGDWLLLLHPLQHPEARFAMLPESTVNGKPVNAVRAWIPDLADSTLAFDKSSGLLVQILFDGREQNRKTLKEFLILDHQEFLGVKLPSKLVYKSNNSQLAEFTVSNVTPLDPIEPKLFTDP